MDRERITQGNEKRTMHFPFEVRAEGDEPPKIVGYASKCGVKYRVGGWYDEIIEPGAFIEAIKNSDVRALFNHDENLVLGRNVAGTLFLEEDDIGLRYEITPPDTPWANGLMENLKRGDVSQSSFAFTVAEEEWIESKGEKSLRKIKKIDVLYDISPVTYPASEATEASVRKAQDLAQPKEPVFDELRARRNMTIKLMEEIYNNEQQN